MLSEAVTIIRAVIALGRGLDLPVVAEGVETQEQLTFLTDEHCSEIQGYFVGRPVVLDLSGTTLSSGGIAHLISELSARDVRVMGLEGTEAGTAPGLPPVAG